MITADKFVRMPVDEQVSTLLERGNELMDRIYIYYVVKLYRLCDFYVEIWYQQTTNRIDRVIVVELDEVIHLYESQINISDLFK
jgi:hypothetical protein